MSKLFDKIMAGGFLAGQKTYIAAATAILSTIGLYLTGEINASGTVSAIVTAIMAIALKGGQNATEDKTKLIIAQNAGAVSDTQAVKATFTDKASVSDTIIAVEKKKA